MLSISMRKAVLLKPFLITCTIIFIASCTSLIASNEKGYKKLKREADAYFIDEVFRGALPRYIKLEEMQPGDAEVNYKIGVCYLHSPYKAKAIPHFEKAKKNDKNKEYSDIDYYLGVAYHYDHQFDKALEFYNKYKIALDTNSDYGRRVLPTINKYIQNTRVGKILVANPVKAEIQHLGNTVNSPNSEIYPVLSYDGKYLYLCSQRQDNPKEKLDDETDEYFEDIYVSTNTNGQWSNLNNLGPVNSFKHDAPISISFDGKKLFFYSTRQSENTDIYFTEFNGQEWGKPVSMGPNINSSSGEFGASISRDGDVFYFSSDRPGGYGGMDIYVSRLQSDGTWGPALNMGPNINTAFDEEAPDILPDNKTLFFSSDGPNSIGGLDIFRTQFNFVDSTWGKPVNMGYPVNTADHEFHVSWDSTGKKGYFSGFRSDSYGEEDIYFVSLEEDEPDTKIYAELSDPKDYAMNKSFKKPVKGTMLEQKVFFDFNMYSKPAEFSNEELQEIVDLMTYYPDMLLEVSGHTDKIGGLQINQQISQKRAQTVMNILVKRGVDPKRLLAKGYAYTKLEVDGKSTLENAPNRRVEFRAISNAEFYKDADQSHIFKDKAPTKK